MRRFFEPETVALIGASPTPGRPGHNLFRNLEDCFGDRFYPVNPRLREIGGRPCYPSILELPAAIDVAVIFIPAASVPEALEQCAAKGVRRVIIESGGFAESGEQGRALQQRCLQIGRRAGMRLWGPNCMGLINVRQTKVLSFLVPDFWKGRFLPGGVSLVVQSGMLSAGFLAHTLSRSPFGLSRIASIGNKMDVDETDLLEYLAGDAETSVIAMYLESIDRGRRFFELCRQARKPIVVLKAGRTALGARAAASHTASLAQNDAVLDGALRQAGVIRAASLNELREVARALELSPPPAASGPRVAVIAFSGGAGVVTSDALADRNLKLAELSPGSVQALKRVFPGWMEPSNPIDLYPAMEKNGFPLAFTAAVEATAADPEVDAVLAHVFSRAARENLDYDRVAAVVRERKKPMVVWTLGDPVSLETVKSSFERAGIPVVDEIDRAVRVLAALALHT
jgi:acetyltransferase